MTNLRPILVGSLLASALAGCGNPRPTPPLVIPPRADERLVVRETVAPVLKPIAAVVATSDMAEARARIGGTLSELLVKEGDQVRQGELLARVTDQRLVLETRALAAAAAAAEAVAVRARADLQRARALHDKGFVAKAALDGASAAAASAEGALTAARAQQGAGNELIAQGAILAPSSGRVLHADVPQGSVVAAGQAVATITSGPPILRLEAPEADATMLREGVRVAIVSGDLPGAAELGVVTRVYPAIKAGRVMADLTVPGLQADLIGRRVRVRLPIGERRTVLVPRQFLSTRSGLDFVRLATRGGEIDAPVQVAPAEGGQVEILSGLSTGDVILGARAGG